MIQDSPGAKLHFLVRDDTRELCRVSMPLSAVDNLSHLFPDEDRVRVTESGIDIGAAAERARSSGYAPQVLIETKAALRSYRIWIE